MDPITKYLNNIAYKFPKGYPDMDNPEEKTMLLEMVNNLIKEEEIESVDDLKVDIILDPKQEAGEIEDKKDDLQDLLKTVTDKNSKDKNARESIILGDKFLADFQSLMINIISLTSALQTPIGTPIPFVPNVAIPVPAVQTQNAANKMLNKIQQYKSQISKSK